jgi:hypothetical protein
MQPSRQAANPPSGQPVNPSNPFRRNRFSGSCFANASAFSYAARLVDAPEAATEIGARGMGHVIVRERTAGDQSVDDGEAGGTVRRPSRSPRRG